MEGPGGFYCGDPGCRVLGHEVAAILRELLTGGIYSLLLKPSVLYRDRSPIDNPLLRGAKRLATTRKYA